MLDEGVRCPADEDHVDEVVEQFQVADRPVGDDLAVTAWRLFPPLLKGGREARRFGCGGLLSSHGSEM